jgi:hypothetical protein
MDASSSPLGRRKRKKRRKETDSRRNGYREPSDTARYEDRVGRGGGAGYLKWHGTRDTLIRVFGSFTKVVLDRLS